jgi:flagellar biosynthesis anti-sigma factor FlgM
MRKSGGVMKINGKKAGGVADNSVKASDDKNNVKKAGDSTSLSKKARGLSRLKTLQSISDARGAKVVKLKTDIEQCAYTVDAGKVAEKMIVKALRDSINSKKSSGHH